MADRVPLYIFSLKDAVEYEERDQWRESMRQNCDCARAIERAIRDAYSDNRLGDCAKGVIEQYGFDRVNWVLANTIQEKHQDGRFSRENKEWARGFSIPKDEIRWQFCVESHPGLIDLFVNQARETFQALGLFDRSHCTEELDYRGKLLLLRPTALKEEYRTGDFQLFFAQSGFGCDPNAGGRKVFGYFLKDGEETHFNRGDFLGVIREEYIPGWAREQMETPEPKEDIEQGMGGM